MYASKIVHCTTETCLKLHSHLLNQHAEILEACLSSIQSMQRFCYEVCSHKSQTLIMCASQMHVVRQIG